jgi:hypothetical protein
MFNLALLLQRQNQYAEAAGYWRRYLANDCQSEWATRAVPGAASSLVSNLAAERRPGSKTELPTLAI